MVTRVPTSNFRFEDRTGPHADTPNLVLQQMMYSTGGMPEWVDVPVVPMQTAPNPEFSSVRTSQLTIAKRICASENEVWDESTEGQRDRWIAEATIQMGRKPLQETAARDHLLEVLSIFDKNTCTHDETYRGGSIWTICHECGMKWADDKGGFKPYEDPPEIAAAREFLRG